MPPFPPVRARRSRVPASPFLFSFAWRPDFCSRALLSLSFLPFSFPFFCKLSVPTGRRRPRPSLSLISTSLLLAVTSPCHAPFSAGTVSRLVSPGPVLPLDRLSSSISLSRLLSPCFGHSAPTPSWLKMPISLACKRVSYPAYFPWPALAAPRVRAERHPFVPCHPARPIARTARGPVSYPLGVLPERPGVQLVHSPAVSVSRLSDRTARLASLVTLRSRHSRPAAVSSGPFSPVPSFAPIVSSIVPALTRPLASSSRCHLHLYLFPPSHPLLFYRASSP